MSAPSRLDVRVLHRILRIDEEVALSNVVVVVTDKKVVGNQLWAPCRHRHSTHKFVW